MQKVLDDETFKMYNGDMFELGDRRFTQYDISNEDILQEFIQKLISKVKIYEGGKVEIH